MPLPFTCTDSPHSAPIRNRRAGGEDAVNTRAGFAGPQLVHAASPEEGTILTYATAEAANLGLPLPTWLQKQINLAKHGHSQNCLLKLKSCQRARKNLKCITLMSHLPSCTSSPRLKRFDLSDWKAFPPLEISPLYKFTKPATEKYDFLSVLSVLFHSLWTFSLRNKILKQPPKLCYYKSVSGVCQ